MKRTQTQTIAQVINEVFNEYNISDMLNEARIIAAWYEELGVLAESTDDIYIKRRILFVKLSSSVVRKELSMRRLKLVELLNKKIGESIISDIVLR